MKKNVSQLLAHAAAQRAQAAAAATGAAVTASGAVPPVPAAAPAAAAAAEGDEPEADKPQATGSDASFLIEGGKVILNGATVADGAVSVKVETQEDGKVVIAGLNVPAAEQPKDISALASELGAMAVAKSAAEATVSELEGQLAACLGIVTASLDKMNVALGSAKIDVSSMSVEALLAQHQSVSTQFAARFPVGGVAAVAPDTDASKKATASVEDREFLARVQAVSKRQPAN